MIALEFTSEDVILKLSTLAVKIQRKQHKFSKINGAVLRSKSSVIAEVYGIPAFTSFGGRYLISESPLVAPFLFISFNKKSV